MRPGTCNDSLHKTSEFVPVESECAVFWRAQDFPPGEFYPAEVLLHTDPMTPAIETERPILRASLRRHYSMPRGRVAR
jgi:hypothetical protein